LAEAGLVEADAPLICGLDADFAWNRRDPACAELEKVFSGLNINSLLFSLPKEPYKSIIDFLASAADGRAIRPSDCETRTMMHDLPIVSEFSADALIATLKQRKSAIVPGKGVISWGTVSPEQAFVFYSSLCFACFVKFFTDFLEDKRARKVSPEQQRVFDLATALLDPLPETPPVLMQGPMRSEEDVYKSIIEAGRYTVDYHLVDSFFGNISYRFGDTLYISQTGSSLDELEGCIDPCPLDGSSCAGITASSEFTAHREIIVNTGKKAILHGHPKFSVILSMICDKQVCDLRGECHIKCKEPRFILDIPIVPGEVGTGPRGLCNTLPPAIQGNRGAIVYGHGLFTVADDDFNTAFANLLDVERACRRLYFEMAG
jgi:ribulose-5-phosphate 4-epimerase/fuculose-1-phosphate aldolase